MIQTKQSKKRYGYVVIIVLMLVAFLFLNNFRRDYKIQQLQKAAIPSSIPTTDPSQIRVKTYNPPTILRKQVYKISMVGDSMTAILGPHGGILSEYMNTLYGSTKDTVQHIIIDNYAKSSNIQSVDSQLEQKTSISEYTFGPLISVGYDLLLVESYAYNPLSQYEPAEALKQQDLALDNLMEKIRTKSPQTLVIFIATISPNIQNYAKGTEESSTDEQRAKQAGERILYLKNHIDYAKKHNIPIINIYEKSLTPEGDGDMKYINPSDDIHPSEAGVEFISHEIGDYIFNKDILPH